MPPFWRDYHVFGGTRKSLSHYSDIEYVVSVAIAAGNQVSRVNYCFATHSTDQASMSPVLLLPELLQWKVELQIGRGNDTSDTPIPS